ncbi:MULTISPECIES: hypothetical protein [unclassified Mesorhizobium]|uniref:hypothetical protein n=1 Tax=unclassified Mesorhizobium TaxID=325217 RepID=UPI000FCC52A3|nr:MULTISPECIES: hypothetical protein [unclassified Mesorhizobium]RUW27658.1 hypothetical protein EOA38_26010 [Mesorhizobium sp. M1E.F.Ca.ET.041.01.1.1]RWD92432.1 MAG: hypothetical protein EOS38_00945 [Mesorhizobium sp.]RWD94459.1 MAG: hypothetical protein EOS39_06765 [Mesorhizobium sp.]TIV52668.1 MAG: hypothetical protein E5V88_11855 [Mesorhizobium sp.]
MTNMPGDSKVVPPSLANRKHWILFGLIFGGAALVAAALYGEINGDSLGYGVGLTSIPALLGFLIMRKGRNLLAGYIAFIVLIGIVGRQEVLNRVEQTRNGIVKGCLDRNTDVDSLPEGQQKIFCDCYSGKLAGKVLQHTTLTALTFSTLPSDAKDDPQFVSIATKAWSECGAALRSQ